MIAVDVISDVICPWCWIGKRRLEKAMTTLGHPVKVRWLPFQLNPTMPKEGISRRDYRTRKFGSWERSLQLDAQVAAAGKAEGIDFAVAKMERTPNFSKRPTLIDVVAEAGLNRSKAEALLKNDEGLEALREADELGRQFRVDAVPFFIVNGKVTLGGAQPPEAILEAFKKAAL